jgi:putative membrane protein
MKKLAGIAFIAIVFFSLQGCTENRRAKNYNDTVLDADAQNFIDKGVESLSTGVQLSQQAIKASKNPAIVDFAKDAVTTHEAVLADLKKLAVDHSAKTPDTLSKIHSLMIAELAKKSGAGFDKQYIQAMVEDNEHAIALFKTVTGNPNKNVIALADKTLPKLREQLKRANDICTDLL